MRAKIITDCISNLYKVKRPIMLWGPPGVGKSSIIHQATDSLGIEMRDVRVSLLDPVDLRGVPHISDGKTEWAIPSFLPTEPDSNGILFLDELPLAPPAMQGALYQLVNDRCIGEYKLPDGWLVVAAGNRAKDRAVSNRMSSALNDRFIHYDFDVNLDDWTEWAMKNGIKSEVISFIRFRTNLLHDFDPTMRCSPTPRSWQFVSDALGIVSKAAEYDTMCGIIGEGPAAEFLGYLKICRNLPNPDTIILNPLTAMVPEDSATLFAITGSLVERATESTFDAIMQYIDRIPIEYQVLVVKDSAKKNEVLGVSKAFIEWTTKNSDVIIGE